MLEKVFKISERKTTVKTEIFAGITTFMTMAYILVVQSSMMEAAGMDKGAMMVVTALLAAAFSIFMGVYANLPFALSAGMGSNAVMAYTLVGGGICTWQTALGMTFISGMVFLLLTVFGLRDLIVKSIPKTIKIAIGTAVGFYIAQLGFSNGHLMNLSSGSIKMGDVTDPATLLTIIGLIIAIVLTVKKVKGAILISIIATTVVGIFMNLVTVPSSFFNLVPPSISPVAFKLDIMGALKLSLFPYMFSFFIGDFFSTLGTVLGVSSKAGLLDENGDLPEIKKPFLVDAIGTVVGSIFGSTVLTTFIESAAGVEEGGRTGLTAVSTGICFLLTIFIAPLALMIPTEATAPALILVGVSMLSSIKDINLEDATDSIVAFLTIMFTIFAGGLGNGISVGIISYVALKLFTGKIKDLNIGIIVLAIPLILNYIL